MQVTALTKSLTLLVFPIGVIAGGFFLGKLYFSGGFNAMSVVANPEKKIEKVVSDDAEGLIVEQINPTSDMEEPIPSEDEEETPIVEDKQPKPFAVLAQEEIFEEELPTVNPMLDYVVLYEEQTNVWTAAPEGQIATKCKLTGEEELELCAFNVIEPDTEKKFIPFMTMKTNGISTFVKENFFDTPKTLYKARVPKSMFDKWLADKSKNLEVYKHQVDRSKSGSSQSQATYITDDKPTITLKPSFGYYTSNEFVGQTQYYAAYSTDFLSSDGKNSDEKEFDPTNKWFKCALPGNTTPTENCFIYELDSDTTRVGSVNKKQVQLPLGKASRVDKNQFYLIKFLNPQTLNRRQYGQQTDVLKVDVYSDQARSKKIEAGIQTLNFKYVSSVIMHHEDWDVGAAIIL